ncbi:conserved hypothetical protein [Gloeothece citriformis PCC 7424]|uniref:Uncharacterized protein n=1 Tax=Gloeothece citriformis (strain PCC 7424) TaxID=65393 RepID=B7KBG6_GLOC7|nr:hypothetical protein [Gloeothece citriformis]ACK71522.1 conserved hypothetical protein [Gloeothece citriformis PCC 7424]
MDKNLLKEDDNRLIRLDYSDLLNTIIKILAEKQLKNPFRLTKNSNQLVIDIDEIAFQVASKQVENPLGNGTTSAKTATVNFSNPKEFIHQIQQIRTGLTKLMKSALTESGKDNSLENYITALATDLKTFQGETKGLSFTYPFNKTHSGLQKQRLSLEEKGVNRSPLLRFHKLTITVEKTHEFHQQLRDSLRNFIELNFKTETEEDRDNLGYILEDTISQDKSQSDFNRLKSLMETEILGKLQRAARIIYLKHLQEQIGKHQDLIYLEILIKRLEQLEAYINDPDKQDGYYQINYAGITFNLRELFNRAEAFDMLPIIPQVCGHLGEIKDEKEGKYQFIFGLKLKLDGKVPTAGRTTVFDYYINFLESESQEHQEGLNNAYKNKFFVEKVFKIALLYFFVFAGNNPSEENYTPESDLNYDPRASFEEKMMPIFQQDDDEKKQKRLRGIKRGLEQYQVNEKLQKLKKLLLKHINQKTKFPTRPYPLHINLKQGILERNYQTIDQSGSFFKSVLKNNPKLTLQYISITDPRVDNTSLSTLPASIQISDIQYFSTEDHQTFSLDYDLRKVKAVPVILVPQQSHCQTLAQNILNDHQGNSKNLIEFTYNYQRLKERIFTDEDNPKIFLYQLTFAILAYISLKLLLDSTKDHLFIPILRLHLTDKQDPSPEEVYLRSLFTVISHLLNETHRSNCQGFCIKDMQFKLKNGLSSLYSILPKIFQLNDPDYTPEIDKLAIVIVSSRECDRSKFNDYKISNLFGQVIGIYRQSDGRIRLYTRGSFSGNYNSQEIHTRPDVVIDEFNKLYNQGYRHFLYIAKSPYSSTINLTAKEEDEGLYFMSKSIIRALKGDKKDMKIYPVFFDKYYVVKLNPPKVNSLYIQDTSELTNIVKDPHKKSVVFFNLFNGITVGAERYYNGVMSYTTLLNIYEGILDETDIHKGLIDDSQLKNDLLQYLTLYHFSKYEAYPTKQRNISLKLDPYQDIIGDDSIGALSIFNQMTGKVKFNYLAFLTEVRKALI